MDDPRLFSLCIGVVIGGPSSPTTHHPQEIGPETRKSHGPDRTGRARARARRRRAARAQIPKLGHVGIFFCADLYRRSILGLSPWTEGGHYSMRSGKQNFNPEPTGTYGMCGRASSATSPTRCRHGNQLACSSPHCIWVGRSSSTGSVSDKRAGAYSAGGRFPFWSQSAILRRVLQVHNHPGSCP